MPNNPQLNGSEDDGAAAADGFLLPYDIAVARLEQDAGEGGAFAAPFDSQRPGQAPPGSEEWSLEVFESGKQELLQSVLEFISSMSDGIISIISGILLSEGEEWQAAIFRKLAESKGVHTLELGSKAVDDEGSGRIVLNYPAAISVFRQALRQMTELQSFTLYVTSDLESSFALADIVTTLAGLHKLSSVHIDATGLLENPATLSAFLKALEGLHNVTELHLSLGNSYDPSLIPEVLARLPKLKSFTIEFSANEQLIYIASFIGNLSRLEQIEHLSLKMGTLSELNIRLLKVVLTQLHTLKHFEAYFTTSARNVNLVQKIKANLFRRGIKFGIPATFKTSKR